MQFDTICGRKLQALGIAALAGIGIAIAAPQASAQSYNHNHLVPGHTAHHTPVFGGGMHRDRDGDFDAREDLKRRGDRDDRHDNGLHLGQRRVYHRTHDNNGKHIGHRYHPNPPAKHVGVRHHPNPPAHHVGVRHHPNPPAEHVGVRTHPNPPRPVR